MKKMLIILIAMIALVGCVAETTLTESGSEGIKVSKAEFDKIDNGMTEKEVFDIIGGEGDVMSETGTKGEKGYTVMYTYDGEGTLGANANFMFQDGKLVTKAQAGLK